MKQQSLGCLLIALLVALTVSVLVNLAQLAGSATHFTMEKTTPSFEEVLIRGHDYSGGKIVVISLYNVISFSEQGDVYANMVDDFVQKLKQAREDEAVKAVIVRIDSPGGEVAASDVLYKAVSEFDKHKPIVAYIESIGASGAYYTAMGARSVMAHDLALTGSIGVILQTLNVKQMTQTIGVTALTFKSGKMKDLLNPFREVNPEEMAFVQGMIDEVYARFVGIVAAERGIEERLLREGVADGRVVSGKVALQEKLIDATGYFEDAIAVAAAEGKLGAEAAVVEYQAPFSFGYFLQRLGSQGESPRLTVEFGPETLRLEAGKLYYLAPHCFAR